MCFIRADLPFFNDKRYCFSCNTYICGTKVQKELERQLEQENEDLKVRDEMGGIEYEQGGGPPMREIDEGSHPDDENVVYENFAAEPEPVHPNQA